MASNHFLNELNIKLAKKSVELSKGDLGSKEEHQTKKGKEGDKVIEKLSPRVKKRARTKRNFDDF